MGGSFNRPYSAMRRWGMDSGPNPGVAIVPHASTGPPQRSTLHEEAHVEELLRRDEDEDGEEARADGERDERRGEPRVAPRVPPDVEQLVELDAPRVLRHRRVRRERASLRTEDRRRAEHDAHRARRGALVPLRDLPARVTRPPPRSAEAACLARVSACSRARPRSGPSCGSPRSPPATSCSRRS